MNKPSVPLGSITEVLGISDLVDEVHGCEDVQISGVSQDSRTVEPGDLFLAWCGSKWDAHDFVASAASAGAAAAAVGSDAAAAARRVWPPTCHLTGKTPTSERIRPPSRRTKLHPIDSSVGW